MNTNPQDIYNTASDSAIPASPVTPPPGAGNVFYVPYPVPQQRRSIITTFFVLVFGLMLFGFCAFMLLTFSLAAIPVAFQAASLQMEDAPLPTKFVSGDKDAKNKIAVLTVSGTIVGNDEGFVQKQISEISRDKNIKAVVLRVVSPGGTISGSDYYYEELKKMKKTRNIPIVVSMGAVAASGGYYVSMVGDEIYAEPTTMTGSIGVIAPMYDLAELCAKIGVHSNPIVSGPHKAMGDITKPMSDEEKKIWQALIDDNFTRFKNVIKEGRTVFANNPEKLDAIATGQVYTADQALANGLIDKIGFLNDASKRAMELVGLTENNSVVVKYATTKGLVDILLESKASENAVQTRLLNVMTSPQLYYLMPGALPDFREE